MKTGIELIAEERREQIEKHGRTIIKDVAYNSKPDKFGVLPLRRAVVTLTKVVSGLGFPPEWNEELTDKMQNKPDKERLIIAGALIAAEIDRLQAIDDAPAHKQ